MAHHFSTTCDGSFSFLLLGVVSIFIAAMGSDSGTDTGDTTYTGEGQVMNVSPEVLKWEPTIRKHAKEFGVEPFVALMLAQMMQESGGRGSDPMQSSEGLLIRNIVNHQTVLQIQTTVFGLVYRNLNMR